MKKTYMVALTALTMSSVFAGDKSTKDAASAQQSDGSMMMQTAYDNMGPKLASARPNIDGHGWYMFGDFLWWNAQEGGTDWSYTTGPEADAPTVAKHKNHHVNFNWSPGFRAGIGWNMDYDEWDTNFYYTWFETSKHSHSHVETGSGETIFPLRTIAFDSGKGSNHWDIHFSMFDWELGRNYFVSPKLSLRPHAGLKGGWINQTVKETFDLDHENIFSEIPTGTVMQNHQKNNMWVVGPSAGLNTKWFFAAHRNHDFSLIGDVAGALMWGHFDVHSKVKFSHPITFFEEFSFGSLTELKSSGLGLNRAVPMLQGMLGWVWDTNFNKDRCHFSMKLAWEVQYWFRVNQMVNFSEGLDLSDLFASADFNYDRNPTEDLIFQGGTLSFRFDF